MLQLLEVLLMLLRSDDDVVLQRTLEVLVIDPELQILSHHIDTLIVSLLKLTRHASSMVR